jgi:ABC-2 type transport system permease protein
MRPLLAFIAFEVGRLLRSWKFLVITIGFPVIFYMLFLGDRASGELVDHAVAWRSYLMVSMCSFGALVAALTSGGARLSSERSSGWARQLRVTPIPAWSYVVTKVTASMVVTLPVIVLVEVVGTGFGGVHLDLGHWVELTAVVWGTAVPFAVLGVLIGFVVHTETAFPIVMGLLFVLGYFGGLFSPVASMPKALRAVAHVLPNFHQAALGLGVLDGSGLAASHLLVLAGYAGALSLIVAWRHRVEESRGVA